MKAFLENSGHTFFYILSKTFQKQNFRQNSVDLEQLDLLEAPRAF